MTTKTIILPLEAFFHARPAAQIAAAAQKHQSIIMIALGTEIADAKDAFSLMRLSHPKGHPLDLLADGLDEDQAIAELEAVLRRIFGDLS